MKQTEKRKGDIERGIEKERKQMEVRANAMMKVAGRERLDRKVTGG